VSRLGPGTGRAAPSRATAPHCPTRSRIKITLVLANPSRPGPLPGSAPQDVSLLVDVCRQCLVFREGRNLVACLRCMAEDPQVALVRVKNRLDPAYDPAASAGYRDVLVNLRVETAETTGLCVAGHVCEVQLILLPFAEIKVPPPASAPPPEPAGARPSPAYSACCARPQPHDRATCN
jgi:hypothetical protein